MTLRSNSPAGHSTMNFCIEDLCLNMFFDGDSMNDCAAARTTRRTRIDWNILLGYAFDKL